MAAMLGRDPLGQRLQIFEPALAPFRQIIVIDQVDVLGPFRSLLDLGNCPIKTPQRAIHAAAVKLQRQPPLLACQRHDRAFVGRGNDNLRDRSGAFTPCFPGNRAAAIRIGRHGQPQRFCRTFAAIPAKIHQRHSQVASTAAGRAAPSRNRPRSIRLARSAVVATLPVRSGMFALWGNGPSSSYVCWAVTSTPTGWLNFTSERPSKTSSSAFSLTLASSRAEPAIDCCLPSSSSAYSQVTDRGSIFRAVGRKLSDHFARDLGSARVTRRSPSRICCPVCVSQTNS